MISVEPGALVVVEQRRLDQVTVDRGEGQRLEAEHLALARPRCRLHQHEIFNADAVGAGFVIAGLVRHYHAGQQRLRVRGFGDGLRALMHTELAADAVPGALRALGALPPPRPALLSTHSPAPPTPRCPPSA